MGAWVGGRVEADQSEARLRKKVDDGRVALAPSASCALALMGTMAVRLPMKGKCK